MLCTYLYFFRSFLNNIIFLIKKILKWHFKQTSIGSAINTSTCAAKPAVLIPWVKNCLLNKWFLSWLHGIWGSGSNDSLEIVAYGVILIIFMTLKNSSSSCRLLLQPPFYAYLGLPQSNLYNSTLYLLHKISKGFILAYLGNSPWLWVANAQPPLPLFLTFSRIHLKRAGSYLVLKSVPVLSENARKLDKIA